MRRVAAPTAEHFEAVSQGLEGDFEGFSDCFGAAGQVDDEAAVADADDGTAEHGEWGYPHGLGAHGLGDAGDLELDD